MTRAELLEAADEYWDAVTELESLDPRLKGLRDKRDNAADRLGEFLDEVGESEWQMGSKKNGYVIAWESTKGRVPWKAELVKRISSAELSEIVEAVKEGRALVVRRRS